MPPLSCMIQRELNNFQTCSQTEFMEWIGVENRHLCNFAQSRHLTGKDFHDARKIISRRVSLYDTLRVIRPFPDLDQVSRFIATLNGMMGKFHDRLVAARAHELRHYRTETFPFPSEIQEKLIWFIHQSSM